MAKRMELGDLPEGAIVFNGRISGHNISPSDGIETKKKGSSIVGWVVGEDPLWEESEHNSGMMEAVVIVIPIHRYELADSVHGMRIKYGNVLDRASSMTLLSEATKEGKETGYE